MFIEATPTTDQLFAPAEASSGTPESPVTETTEKASAFKIEILSNAANPEQLILQNVTNETPVQDIIDSLKLKPYDKVLFVMGGAGGLVRSPNNVEDTIVELSRRLKGRLLVIDGGSDSGIIKIIGQAMKRLAEEPENRFQAVGISPAEQLTYEGRTVNAETADTELKSHQADRADNNTFFPPEPNHTRIVTVSTPDTEGNMSAEKGEFWGKEREVMYKLGNALANQVDSAGITVNGGGLTLAEVEENLLAGRNLMVVKGTLRVADAICAYKDNVDPNTLSADARPMYDKVANVMENLEAQGIDCRRLIHTVPLENSDDLQETMMQLLAVNQPEAIWTSVGS